MITTFLGNIKKGGLFKIKESETAPIWMRDDYDRSEEKYLIYKYEDVNKYSLRGGHITVYALSELDLKDMKQKTKVPY